MPLLVSRRVHIRQLQVGFVFVAFVPVHLFSCAYPLRYGQVPHVGPARHDIGNQAGPVFLN